MEQTLTAKVRLYPTAEQAEMLKAVTKEYQRLYAYQLLAKDHKDISSDPTQKEWEQLMNQANRYADEDVVDDLEYWKLLIDGQQDD